MSFFILHFFVLWSRGSISLCIGFLVYLVFFTNLTRLLWICSEQKHVENQGISMVMNWLIRKLAVAYEPESSGKVRKYKFK